MYYIVYWTGHSKTQCVSLSTTGWEEKISIVEKSSLLQGGLVTIEKEGYINKRGKHSEIKPTLAQQKFHP
jgi:hypothetical protein